MLQYAEFDVPGGSLTVVTDSAATGDRGARPYGAVIAATYRGVDDAVDRLASESALPERGALRPVAAVVERYLNGDLAALDEISVWQPGGPYQCEVWAQMRTIRPGSVDTYGELARKSGRPRAFRAVGTACSSNLVALFVPCHRVVASNGLGGYGYGLPAKRALLDHEGADY